MRSNKFPPHRTPGPQGPGVLFSCGKAREEPLHCPAEKPDTAEVNTDSSFRGSIGLVM